MKNSSKAFWKLTDLSLEGMFPQNNMKIPTRWADLKRIHSVAQLFQTTLSSYRFAVLDVSCPQVIILEIPHSFLNVLCSFPTDSSITCGIRIVILTPPVANAG